jgi:GNAT superfamily N-acetyltransferase
MAESLVTILRQTLLDGLDQYKALAADGAPIGSAIVYRVAQQPASLKIVKVERAYRRAGIGRALVRRVVSDNAAIGVICQIDPLDDTISRAALVKFYRRCGAQIDRRGCGRWLIKQAG